MNRYRLALLLFFLLLLRSPHTFSNYYWEYYGDLTRSRGARQYTDYVIDPTTGFLRLRVVKPVLADETSRQPTDKPVGEPHDFTRLEAVPFSLEQFIRSYGHALLDSSYDIHEIAPVVHLHYLWIEETNRPISLPCWAPAQPALIEFGQTTFRGHKRTWLIGQGNTLSLRCVLPK